MKNREVTSARIAKIAGKIVATRTATRMVAIYAPNSSASSDDGWAMFRWSDIRALAASVTQTHDKPKRTPLHRGKGAKKGNYIL